LRQTVQLRGRRLVKSNLVFEAKDPDRFKQTQRAKRIGICRIFRRFERDTHMALRGQIVDFGRLHFLNDANEVRGIGHVAVVQKELYARAVRILIKMINACAVERRRSPFDAVHDIAFAQQQLGEVSAVLAGRAGDQCDTVWHERIRADLIL
jgi:hypothetical protein